MDEHIAGCADCYEVFSETVQFRLREAPAPALAFVRRPAFKVAAGFAIAAALVLALSLRLYRAPSRRAAPLVAELAEAMGARRFIEPRLTGGFHHGRLITLRSGESPHGLDAQSPAVLGAVARIRERAQSDRPVGAGGANEGVTCEGSALFFTAQSARGGVIAPSESRASTRDLSHAVGDRGRGHPSQGV